MTKPQNKMQQQKAYLHSSQYVRLLWSSCIDCEWQKKKQQQMSTNAFPKFVNRKIEEKKHRIHCEEEWNITLSTFSLVLADVSTYGTPHCCARFWQSANETFRLSFKSHLLPTNRNGMLSSFFTRRICSLKNHRTMKWVRVARMNLNELPEFLCRLKAFVVRYGEHTKETFATAEIIVPNRGIVFLTGRIENVYLYFFAVENHLERTPDHHSNEFHLRKRVRFSLTFFL